MSAPAPVAPPGWQDVRWNDSRESAGSAAAPGESDSEVMATEQRQSASALRRFFRKLVASEAELDAEELKRGAAASGCSAAASTRRGQMVTLSGRLRTVVYTPRTNLPTLEADLYDGTDVVTLIWLGRRHIAGIEPGRRITARGRVAQRDGRRVIFNPYYELDPHGEA
jgi:hypothetical protein